MSFSARRALRRFGFRRTIRGALIVGVLVGLLMGAQGAAYAKAFPDEVSRQKLVASLESVSAVNFLSGEIANAAAPASYAIYKSLPLVTLIAGVWGLMVTTRLLRGNEEDGRMELLATGMATKRQASGQLLAGFGYSFLLACSVAFVCIAAMGAVPNVSLSAGASALMAVSVFLPGLFFGGLGVLTSQLALTRGRAVMYGLIPLLIFYIVRGSANSVASVDWLKRLTPFGWSDLLNPVLAPHTVWIAPALACTAVFLALGLWWAGRRDLGAALVHQSDTVKSRFYLLHTSAAFAVRRNIWSFAWWGLGTVALAAFFAALAGISVDLMNDSSAFRQLVPGTSDQEIMLAFLGVGTLFVAVVLLIMATLNFAAIRRDEARGYLDNLLVQPTRRNLWLIGRLLLAATSVTAISVLSGVAIWLASRANQVDVSFGVIMQGALSLAGVFALVLGVGTFFYGLLPRMATASMAVVIGWAFVVDVLKSLFSLNDAITKTSLLSYVPANPAQVPDWTAFVWLAIIGLAFAAIGIARFTKRDIVTE